MNKKGYITMKDINKLKNDSIATSEESPAIPYQNIEIKIEEKIIKE
jgi:hypothetical protein